MALIRLNKWDLGALSFLEKHATNYGFWVPKLAIEAPMGMTTLQRKRIGWLEHKGLVDYLQNYEAWSINAAGSVALVNGWVIELEDHHEILNHTNDVDEIIFAGDPNDNKSSWRKLVHCLNEKLIEDNGFYNLCGAVYGPAARSRNTEFDRRKYRLTEDGKAVVAYMKSKEVLNECGSEEERG